MHEDEQEVVGGILACHATTASGVATITIETADGQATITIVQLQMTRCVCSVGRDTLRTKRTRPDSTLSKKVANQRFLATINRLTKRHVFRRKFKAIFPLKLLSSSRILDTAVCDG